ncbi:hypothetical protein [Bacillus sp. AIIW2]|uniref:hypothetical protein n=1 Tax=Bacillus sp. AIIW2 TaxID=1811804 RepID=UPI001374F63D|nr:hypothetical protein [Bacillus sp. AIIW2]
MMPEKIIDEVNYLMTLTDDELNELLISEKYNKANLRELVRRTLKVANEYKKAFEYETSEEKKETDESLKRYDRMEAENERLKEGRRHLTEIIARLIIQNFELMDECIPDWRYHCTDLLYELKEALR